MNTQAHPSILVLLLLSTLNLQLPIWAQGTAFTYQGRLNDGANPASGIYDVRFAIYDSSGGPGVVAGPLTNSPVAVSNGLFTVTLDFGSGVFTGADRWLEIAVRTNGGGVFTSLSPRRQFTPAPYAIFAGGAQAATTVAAGGVNSSAFATGAVGSAAIADGSIAASDLTSGLLNNTFWRLGGNTGTTPGAHFLGTTDNRALELKVNHWRGLRLEPALDNPFYGGVVNVLIGSPVNELASGVVGATISGGGALHFTNRVAAHFGTISGGRGNRVGESSDGATIGGGRDNRIGSTGYYSLITGGSDNAIADGAEWSAILGGADNIIGTGSDSSTVGGGTQNHVGPDSHFSVVGGGQLNAVGMESPGSTIAGGIGSEIAANASIFVGGSDHCTIGGGYHNSIGRECFNNTVAGGYQNHLGDYSQHSAIGGGHDNRVFAYANGTTIGGGEFNTNAGPFCTIPGGRGNYANGTASFAAGQNAKANHTRSFVWSSRPSPAPSFSGDRFHVHAAEGFSVDYAGQRPDGGGNQWVVIGGFSNFPGQTISTWTGARLTDGGVWTDNSDRNAKENFKPVDSREVLERVAKLPVQKWNYKTEGPAVRHIGPVAQDFYEAFRTGADDKHLAALDSAGVALAAIQGLNEKVEGGMKKEEVRSRRLEEKLEQKETEIAELNARLSQLEELVRKLAARQNGHIQ